MNQIFTRREFLATLTVSSFVGISGAWADVPFKSSDIAKFCKQLKPIGRILETEGYYVWCNAPIYAPDGKVHVFYSRWPAKYKMGGWIHQSEIAHAVADSPESEFTYKETVIAPRGSGYWDGTTCHNPHIQLIDGKYCLFYMGNSNGKTNTKRIGLATADSLDGPWIRPDKPLLEVGSDGSWDDHCTTNPAFLKHPNGEYWLYYKSWNTKEYEETKPPAIRGNRKYGLAISKQLEGPYLRYEGNPIIDFSGYGGNRQVEDAYIYYEKKRFRMIMRDMGFFNHEVGLYFESKDGLHWSKPKIAYYGAEAYFKQPPAPAHLTRYGRFERPQLLMKNGKPAYLFTATQGGSSMTSSGYVFKLEYE